MRSLIFPQWDMVTVILCVFLLSYVYGEGKVSKIPHSTHFTITPSLRYTAEQLFQGQHPGPHLSCHRRGLLCIRLQLGSERYGYRSIRHSSFEQ